jgi:hypothetical protein
VSSLSTGSESDGEANTNLSRDVAGRRDGDYPAGGRAAARETGTADREGGTMGTRKRAASRFQVEALEGRLAPGGAAGAMGGEFRQAPAVPLQAHVAPSCGGAVARPESAPALKAAPP